MSSIVLFVKILGVTGSTLSDADTGLVNGNLQWASVSNIDGYKSGIIDESAIDGVTIACNISQGGTLGGFDGNVNISAISDEVMLKVISGQFILIGREIHIDVGVSVDPNAAIRRYTGTIGTWESSDEITLDIVCMPNTAFNKKVIPSVTITKELALNVADSNAIGKNVTTTYGNICDFPLTVIPSSAVSYAGALNSDPAVQCSINQQTPNGLACTTTSGRFNGFTNLQVFGIYQEHDDQYIWICLSANGRENFFTSAMQYHIPELKSNLVGVSLNCNRGIGAGETVKILNIEWASHDTGSVFIDATISETVVPTVWIQINTIDKTKFSNSIGYALYDPSYSANTCNFPLSERNDSWGKGLASLYFTGTYNKRESWTVQDANSANDISYLNFCSFDNIFSVSKSVNLSDCKLVGMDNNNDYKSVYVIPANSIDVLYENDIIRIIKLNVDNVISQDSSSFGLSKFISHESCFHEIEGIYGLNVVGWNRVSGTTIGPATTYSDGFTSKQNISEGYVHQITVTNLDGSGNVDVNYKDAQTANTFLVPLADLINGNDLSSGDFTTCLIPKIKIEYTPVTSFVGRECRFNIRINVIGESNVSYGYVNSTIGGLFNNGTTASVEINPDTNDVIFSDNFSLSHSEYAKIDFNRLMSELDVTSIIKTIGIDKINCFHITVLFVAYGHYDVSATFKKTISPCRIGFTKQIAKDKLFLRSARVNELVTNVDSPAMLALSIARENGINVTASSLASFVDTQGSQRGLYYTDPEEFDGQYQPDDNTSVLDALSEIAKQSMMAIYTERDGSIRANWFADMDATSPVVHTFTDVIKKSMKISKNQNGYRYTDFVFTIMKNNYQKKEILYINTDVNTGSFPDSGLSLRSGPIYNAASNWIIIRSDNLFWTDYIGSHQVMGFYFRRSALLTNPMLVFTRGTKWVLTDIYNNEMIAELTVIAIDPLCPLGYLGAKIGFTMEGRADTFSPSSFQLYGPNPYWNSFVSGTFITDYTIARNIWEHANDARKALGCERSMPSANTTLIDPIWGSDDRALMQWSAYTTIFCTREKTVISFSVEMNLETMALWVMDYVEFAWGVYSNAHTKGWIVDIEDDYKKGIINFKILTSISDSDVLILDERTNQYSMIADSTTPDFTTTYDQGALA